MKKHSKNGETLTRVNTVLIRNGLSNDYDK